MFFASWADIFYVRCNMRDAYGLTDGSLPEIEVE